MVLLSRLRFRSFLTGGMTFLDLRVRFSFVLTLIGTKLGRERKAQANLRYQAQAVEGDQVVIYFHLLILLISP